MRLLIIALLILMTSTNLSNAQTDKVDTTIQIFSGNMIHFFPDSAGKFDTENVTALENGRVVETKVSLPKFNVPVNIYGILTLEPIPKDEIVVYDKWDRAGNVRLAIDGQPDVELIKFITSYGGYTEYEVDLSHLAPLLSGEHTIKGFIDTWVTPAWKMSFDLVFVKPDSLVNPVWNYALMFNESFDAAEESENGIEVAVEVPEGMNRVLLNYLVSGHCTDGNGADEFVQKDNVISVDGVVVYRFRPWREDCRDFRVINPYTRRWSDGYWSSDYARSGWCPGDWVAPVELDLTDHLTPGKHTVRFNIENVRPKDENDHYGYWRISSYLVGWDELPVVEN